MTRLARLPLLAGLAALAAGCGGEPTGTVSGTVSLDGKPVPAGSVSVLVAGVPYPSDIKDGRYSAGPMPVGEAVVLVYDPPGEGVTMQLDKEQLEALRLAKKAPPPPKAPPKVVPPQYGDTTRSPLKTTVRSGANEFNIELKK